MKFTIPSDDLSSLLSRSSLLATGDRTHPAYGLTYLQVTSKGRLKTQVVNSMAGAVNSAQTGSGEDSLAGEFCLTHLNVKELQTLLVTKCEVNVQLVAAKDGQAQSLRVRTPDMSARIDAIPAIDAMTFPKPPGADEAAWMEINPEIVEAICSKVAPFAAPDKDERANLSTVHLTSQYSEASDGMRCVRIPVSILPSTSQDIFAPSALFPVLKAYIDGKTTLRIAVTATHIWVIGKGWALFCRPLDVTYPPIDTLYYPDPDDEGMVVTDYKGSKHMLSMMEVDRAALVLATQRIASIYRRPSNSGTPRDDVPIIKFSVRDGTLMAVSSKAPMSDSGIDLAQKIPWKVLPGADLGEKGIEAISTIRLNARYLSSIISCMHEDYVTLMWTHARERLQLVSESGMKALLMPRGD